MNVTKSQLKEIIREELKKVYAEGKLNEMKVKGPVKKFKGARIKDIYIDIQGVSLITDKGQLDIDKPQGVEVVSFKGKSFRKEGKLTEDWKSGPGFSSKEAKNILDNSIRKYSKLLRKAQYDIIKDWMSKAKAGVIDYFDIVRGLQTGDASRAKPYETKFLQSVLEKDKIISRFRKYFGGKKGKRIR